MSDITEAVTKCLDDFHNTPMASCTSTVCESQTKDFIQSLRDQGYVIVPLEPEDPLWHLPVLTHYVAKFNKSMSQAELDWLRKAMTAAYREDGE